MTAQEDRRAIRQRMRQARRQLGDAERRDAADQVAARLARMGLPRPHSRVGVYLPMDGELDPGPVMRLARSRRCRLYVPVITSFRRRHMRFAPLADGAGMRRNRWGIHEPEGTGIGGRWLDLVLVPCVAFDPRGDRLGMGAGFFDRHFSFLAHRGAWRRPRLLGLAYDLQRVDSLAAAPWDVRLWGIVTERATYGRAADLD